MTDQGRPAVGVVGVRVTAEERAAWIAAAGRAGMGLSMWVRGTLTRAAGGGGPAWEPAWRAGAAASLPAEVRTQLEYGLHCVHGKPVGSVCGRCPRRTAVVRPRDQGGRRRRG